jgi:hypothetical protein
MAVQKPADLIRFISNIPVLGDGTVPVNTMVENVDYVSPLYTPDFTLSMLARMCLDVLNTKSIDSSGTLLDPNTIVFQVLNSDLDTYAPDIYLLARTVVLEGFAMLYYAEQAPENLRYITKADIVRTKTNIQYITDYLSTELKYLAMIDVFRMTFISLGYLENQLEVIMVDKGVL